MDGLRGAGFRADHPKPDRDFKPIMNESSAGLAEPDLNLGRYREFCRLCIAFDGQDAGIHVRKRLSKTARDVRPVPA
jgi:hypothetical protein